MENKLQELTQKLYNEGVEKANTEAEKIIEKAVTAGATLSKAAQKTFWGGYSGYFSKTQTATYGKLLTIPFSG